jgi:hypothetical protein
MARNPGVGRLTHSVTSAVITYYLTVAIIDDSANRLIRHLEEELKEEKALYESQAEKIKELTKVCDMKVRELESYKREYTACRESLIDLSARYRAAKADLINSWCFYRCETFPDPTMSKIPGQKLQ